MTMNFTFSTCSKKAPVCDFNIQPVRLKRDERLVMYLKYYASFCIALCCNFLVLWLSCVN